MSPYYQYCLPFQLVLRPVVTKAQPAVLRPVVFCDSNQIL